MASNMAKLWFFLYI